jgi:hypothetical protein
MRDPSVILAAAQSPRPHRRWIIGIALAVLFTVHGVLTLQLFGRPASWRNLITGDAVTSGRHAQHLEESSRECGATGTFDPSEYAGYPRTAVFDTESRPAEWFQIAVGGIPASTYKIGLAVSYWLVPAVFWLAAVLLRSSHGTALTAAALGILVAWSGPAVETIEAGDVSISSLGCVAALGLAIQGRWHSRPGALPWCGLVAVGALGWSIQPQAWLAFFALSLVGWAVLGRWHGFWWHGGLVLAHAVALALNYPVWSDWVHDWWVRLPLSGVVPAVSIRPALVFGLWLAVLPAAWGVSRAIRRAAAQPSVGLIAGSAIFLIVAGLVARRPLASALPAWGPRPLAMGIRKDALQLEDAVRAASSPDARVLWEDLPGRPDLGWTALLPRRLARPFVGGLDPEGALEHASCALRAGALAGRPLAAWNDSELDSYARRYNIGSVVCATTAARDRFERWPAAEAVRSIDPNAEWRVYRVGRPHSFVLKGHAKQFEADVRRVTLADVVPEDGEVVLSLHYQNGCRARPAWVRVERELDAYDPIPFIRLRMPGPLGRITLTWDAR